MDGRIVRPNYAVHYGFERLFEKVTLIKFPHFYLVSSQNIPGQLV